MLIPTMFIALLLQVMTEPVQVPSSPPASVIPGVPAGRSGGVDRGGMPGRSGRSSTPVDNSPRTLAPYFTLTTPVAKAPDGDGFLQRWLLLEPISNSLRSNTGFTEAYVRNAFDTEYFPNQFTVVPRDGEKVAVNGETLAWHALDSTLFNVKLFRFAYGVNKPVYGVTFWAVTVVDCPRELRNVRLAAGSNSASMWWVNGKEAVGLFGDRRMVMDDGVSRRLTLNKGRNIIRGAVINGPGMSDFCVRFIDEDGNPVKDFTTDLELAGR
jgi:hypothetical protein